MKQCTESEIQQNSIFKIRYNHHNSASEQEQNSAGANSLNLSHKMASKKDNQARLLRLFYIVCQNQPDS